MMCICWYTTKIRNCNNIPAMKTTSYINRKDIIAIIAVIILFALMMPTPRRGVSETVQPVPVSLQFRVTEK